MGTIWVQEFTGGLDTRRLPETTVGGVLIKAKDGHITRGGEFEQRAAFVKEYTLPAGTVGLAFNLLGPVVFGTSATLQTPAGVQYQVLGNPDAPGTALSKVLSYDLYSGALYVAAEFTDGSRLHFFNGSRVTDWYDGRARATFQVVSGGATTAAGASAHADILGGSAGAGNEISTITVAGVPIIAAPVAHTGNNSTTATAVAAAINSAASTPDYTATASGVRVTITAVTPGSALNGQGVSVTVGGDVVIGNGTAFAGGADNATSSLNDLTINGVSVLDGPVLWAGSAVTTAQAIAQAINQKTSAPDYTATVTQSEGNAYVNLLTAAGGGGANGYVVAFSTSAGLVVSPASGLTMQGGSNTQQLLVPGDFVRTIGTKVYSTSGPNLHFSGVSQPTKWTTDTAGAGFIDFSAQASGLEHLYAVAEYQQYVAIFAERVTKIQYVDPDPALNKSVQILRNTGTASPRSVTQFGDNDIFYLDESGVRSLRARDASNAASTSDVGVAIDSIITDKLASLLPGERQKVIGLIEPRDGRFWLIIKDTIYVFSFFSGAKISAWSTYEPGFAIDDAGVFQRRVYVRSGNSIYVYGGLGTSPAHDETVAEAWLPYLDASKPTTLKKMEGIDAAVTGLWEVSVGMEPTDLDAADVIGRMFETTYRRGRVPVNGESTHFNPRFKSVGQGPHKLASVVVQFAGGGPDDKD